MATDESYEKEAGCTDLKGGKSLRLANVFIDKVYQKQALNLKDVIPVQLI